MDRVRPRAIHDFFHAEGHTGPHLSAQHCGPLPTHSVHQARQRPLWHPQYSPAGHGHATSKATSGQLQGQIAIFPWALLALDGPEQPHLRATPPPMGPGGYLSSAGDASLALKDAAGLQPCSWPCPAGPHPCKQLLPQVGPSGGCWRPGLVLGLVRSSGQALDLCCSLVFVPVPFGSWLLDCGCVWGCQQTLLHPSKGRGGEARAVPCSQRSLNVCCGDIVLGLQEHSQGGSSWGATSVLPGEDLIQGRWDVRPRCLCSRWTSGRVFHLAGVLQVWWKVSDPGQAALHWALL